MSPLWPKSWSIIPVNVGDHSSHISPSAVAVLIRSHCGPGGQMACPLDQIRSPVLHIEMLALWRVMNCSVSWKEGKKRRGKTIKINLGWSAGCTDADTETNNRAQSVYQHCCLCSKDHNRLAIAHNNVMIFIFNGSVPADVVHSVLPYRNVYIVLVHARVCGLLAARYSAIIINKASQLSRQQCSLTACLQTLDHLVFLSTSGLLSQHSATASPSISRSLSLPFRSLSFYLLIFFTVWGALDWTAAAS